MKTRSYSGKVLCSMPSFLAQPSTLFFFFPPLIFRGGLVLLHTLAAAPALTAAAMPNREGRARGTGVRAVQWSP